MGAFDLNDTLGLDTLGPAKFEVVLCRLVIAAVLGAFLGFRPWRRLLPNALPVLIVAASLYVGQVILIEAALDFLGLGIQEPTASWGNMLSNSQVYFVHSAWLVVIPGICIFVTVLATNIFGNAVRDAYDPRLRLK